MPPNVTQQVIVTARHTKTDNVPAHRHEYTERSVEPTEKRAAPDGGWGWVVVAAATICFAFTWGQQKAFGIYMIDIMDMLGSNVMHTSTIGGLNTALSYLFAPLASVIYKKYGARRTCIVGGLLAGSGLILGFVTNSLIILYIGIGVINGVGIAIIVIASFSIVNEYFDKRGAMATAICVTGAGVGSLTWPPLTNILVEAYTYQGAFLVTGAAVLNVIVCGLLFRPLTEPRRAVAPSTTATGNQRDDQLNQRVSIVEVDAKMASRMKSVGQPQSEAGRSEEHFPRLTVPNGEAGSPATLEAQLWGDRERYMEDCVDWSNNDGSQSIGNTGMNGKNGATTPGTAATVTGQRHNAETQENAEGFHHQNYFTDDGPLTFTVYNIYDDAMPIRIDTQLDDCVSSEGGMCPADKYRRNSLDYVSSPMTVEQRVAHLPVTETSEYQKPLTEIVSQVLSQQSQDVDNDKRDNREECSVPVVYQSVQDPLKLITVDFDRADQRNNMRVGRYGSSNDLLDSDELSQTYNGTTARDVDCISRNAYVNPAFTHDITDTDDIVKKTPPLAVKKKARLISTKLFKSVRFWIMMLSFIPIDFGYTTISLYLPMKSVEIGGKQANESTAVTLLYLVDTAVRILLSIAYNAQFFQSHARRQLAYCIFTLLAGIGFTLLMFVQTMGLYLIASGIIGACTGSMICASWVVMRDVVGSARYTDACALRQFLEAPILFVAPMILGAAYDSKQGTRPVFTIIGVLMLLSAAIAVPLPILTRRREKKLREGDSADTVAAEAESSDSSEEESEDAFFDGMPSNVVIM